MNEYCFQVRNLTRVFAPRLAIYVPRFDIPRGKLIAIVGKSGSGKTTLLETLGLLSQPYATILTNSQIVFYPELDGPGIDYRDLWRNPDRLNSLRINYMTFMFQRANLMPHFNVRDNIAISRVMQGVNIVEAQKDADKLIAKMFDFSNREDIRKFGDKEPNQISGGEAQRVALARSIIKKACILFADEPTGNVDEQNSIKIFEMIREYVDNSDSPNEEKRTAIIVTHNIPLALNFADVMISITRNGMVCPDKVLESKIDLEGKRIWYGFSDCSSRSDVLRDQVDDSMEKAKICLDRYIHIQSQIHELPVNEEGYILKNDKTPYTDKELRPNDWDMLSSPQIALKVEQEVDVLSLDLNAEVTTIAQPKEFKRIYSRGKHPELLFISRNSVLLAFMIMIAFLSIGIGKGGLKKLSDKMEDPFARWLSIVFSFEKRDNLLNVVDSLRTKEVTQRFSIEDVRPYYLFWKHIWSEYANDYWSHNHNPTGVLWRAIDPEDPILEKIMSSENLIRGEPFEYIETIGVIASQEYVDKFCYDKEPAFIRVMDHNEPIGVPVVAIVKHLPNSVMLMATNYFLDQYLNGGLKPTNSSRLSFFTNNDYDGAWNQKEILQEFLSNHFADLEPTVSVETYNSSWQPGHLLLTRFTDADLNYKRIKEIAQKVVNSVEFQDDNLLHLYDLHEAPVSHSKKYDLVSVYFNELDSVKVFRDFLKSNFELDADMARVEALDNYNFVTRLTMVLALAVVIISIIGITIFIANILMEHLSNNRVYIGIFKAMGISDDVMQSLYRKKMVPFILKGILVAILGSFIIGYLIMNNTMSALYFDVLNIKPLNIVNLTPLIFILSAYIFSAIGIFITAKRFLNHSPGDLIYDRIGNSRRTSPPQ